METPLIPRYWEIKGIDVDYFSNLPYITEYDLTPQNLVRLCYDSAQGLIKTLGIDILGDHYAFPKNGARNLGKSYGK